MGALGIETVRRILSRHPRAAIVDSSLTPAAVACLLYPKNGEYCVLLNKRSELVANHKGELCFPGGRRDPEDRTLLDTALRETHEEMGIHPQDIEILGELDDMPTTSNFLISTYVGTIPYPYDFKPSNIEVAQIVEVPISRLIDSSSWRDEVRVRGGRLVYAPSYAYEGHLIYGATARVLQRFLQLLEAAPGKENLWKRETPQS